MIFEINKKTDIEVLKFLKEMHENMDTPSDKRICVAYDNAIKALEEKEADRWIKCSERKPEEQRSVLICYRTQGGIAQAVSERFIRNDGTEGWSAMLGRKPFAWKELGEPYNPWKKKKENDK